MIQMLATLLFLLAAGAGVAVIAASLIDDWALMLRALGFGVTEQIAPLPPQARAVVRPMPLAGFSRRLEEVRVAA